jgi:hypothetical protein
LQPAAIIAKFHFVLTEIRHTAVNGCDPNGIHQVTKQAAAEMSVAGNPTSNGTGCPGPPFKPGEAMINRPAHQTIDCHTGFSPDDSIGGRFNVRPPRSDDKPTNSPIAYKNIRSPAKEDDRYAGAGSELQRTHGLVRIAGLEKPIGGPPCLERGQWGQWDRGADSIGSEVRDEFCCVKHKQSSLAVPD